MLSVNNRLAATAVAGCAALTLALTGVAGATADHAAGGSHAVKSGSTTLAVNVANYTAISTAGFTVSPTGGASLSGTSVVFKITGGSLNSTATAGTVKQAGGLAVSNGKKTIDLTNAVANVATRKVLSTVTGKGSNFPAFVLGKPSKRSVTKKGATISGYTVTVSPQLVAYLDKTYKTKAFSKYKLLGTATTKVTFK